MFAPCGATMAMTGHEHLPNTIMVFIVKRLEADFHKNSTQKEVIRKR